MLQCLDSTPGNLRYSIPSSFIFTYRNDRKGRQVVFPTLFFLELHCSEIGGRSGQGCSSFPYSPSPVQPSSPLLGYNSLSIDSTFCPPHNKTLALHPSIPKRNSRSLVFHSSHIILRRRQFYSTHRPFFSADRQTSTPKGKRTKITVKKARKMRRKR